jgi:hypothetical protein
VDRVFGPDGTIHLARIARFGGGDWATRCGLTLDAGSEQTRLAATCGECAPVIAEADNPVVQDDSVLNPDPVVVSDEDAGKGGGLVEDAP